MRIDNCKFKITNHSISILPMALGFKILVPKFHRLVAVSQGQVRLAFIKVGKPPVEIEFLRGRGSSFQRGAGKFRHG
jgi:hypothetical protein